MRTFGLVLVLSTMCYAVRAQWHQLPGPPAGGPYCFLEIADSTRIYAGTEDGVWLSTDHMKSWTRAGLEGHLVTIIAEYSDHAYGTALFAATYDALFRTIDSGTTWTQVEGPLQPYVQAAPIVAVFQNSSNVFVVFSDAIDTATCVWRSTDIGNSWTRFAPYVPDLYGPNSADTMNGILFALMEDGQFHYNLFSLSLAGGQWQPVNYTSGHNFSIIKANGQNLYATGRDVWTTTTYLDVSTDAGVSWNSLLSRPLDSFLSAPDAIAINGRNFVLDFNRDAYSSTDGGSSWNRRNRNGEFSEGRALGFLDDAFLLSEGNGLFRSANGVTWESVPVPALSREVNLVATTQKSIFAVGSWGTIFQSTDRGQSWIEPGHLEGVSQLASSQQALFASWFGGVSRWSAEQWDSLDFPFLDNTLLQVDQDTVLYLGNGFWVSHDLGSSWQSEPALPFTSLFMLGDTLFATSLTQTHYPFGNQFYEFDLKLSTDWGSSWRHRSTLAADSGYFNGETLAAADRNSIFIFLPDTGLLVSSDGGYSWRLIDTDYVRCLASIGSKVFASLGSKTPDHPSGLYDITNGFRLIVPDSIAGTILSVAADDSLLYLGTESRGLWANALANIPLVVPIDRFAASDMLKVYPNPSRGSVTATFSLPERSHVRLTLVSELGGEVAILFDGVHDAGEASVPLALGKLPNGIYEIILRADEMSLPCTAKLVIAK